jgi:hypothetical protein
MFMKILMANRGDKSAGLAALPNCLSGAARQGK